MKKIYELNRLSKIVKSLRNQNKKVVLSHGAFDLLHIGHIKHFEAAKKKGDKLIVSLTKDQFIDKGPNRPYFNLKLRMEAIAALSCVDYVTFSETDSSVDVIEKIKPNIYVKGQDYKIMKDDVSKKIYKEKAAVEKFKGKINFTEEIKFSSSKLLNNFNFILNEDQKKFLARVSKKIQDKKLFDIFKKLKTDKTVILGEIIIDKYNFCETLGKSGKDPILMFSKKKEEIYLGGAGAIANHISQLSDKVQLCSIIGSFENYLNFINKNISKKVKKKFFVKKNSPTIEKQKYLDHVSLNKIIGFYNFKDENISNTIEKKINKFLNKNIIKDTTLLVADYGHGMITDYLAEKISKMKNFVTLNAQINAANYGTHSIKKYKNINIVIINETELRNELRDSADSTENLMKKISKTNNFKIVVVTKGKDGSILFNKAKNKFFYCPAFAVNVVDKIGSGDAMLSVISSVYKISGDEDLSLFLGSLAAAQKVQAIGNSKSINGEKLIKTFHHLIN